MKNPYEFDYDEYLEIHNIIIKNSKICVNVNEDIDKKFITDEEVMNYYGAAILDNYIKKLREF